MSSLRTNLRFESLKTKWRELLLVGVIFGQGLFAVWVGILIFYRTGAYFLDAGYYSYTLASENFTKQPPSIGDAWGSSLYATHMLITPLVISQFFRVFFDAPLNFIAFLGIQNLALATAGALLMMVAFSQHASKKSTIYASGIIGALLAPFSNIGLGSLLYPHVELIGTSLVAIAVLLLAVRWQGDQRRSLFFVAVACLFFGLFAREDIGVHLGTTVAAAFICSPWKKLGRAGFIRLAWLAGASVAGVVLLMGYQRFFADSKGVFSLTYSGSPAYAHITSVWYLIDRALTMLASRLDLLIGLFAFVGAAVFFRKREYLAFPLAALPWLLLNMTAIDPSKNAMGIYHLFPIILYATAPLLALSLTNSAKDSDETTKESSHTPLLLYATYGVALLSLFLGGVSSAPTGGGGIMVSLLRMPPISPSGITGTHKIIEEFAEIGTGIAVDDGVMSIRPVDLQYVPLIPGVSNANDFNSALFFSTYQLGHKGLGAFIESWISGNRQVIVTCLPGSLVRLDALEPTEEPTGQEMNQVFNKAIRCHPLPRK